MKAILAGASLGHDVIDYREAFHPSGEARFSGAVAHKVYFRNRLTGSVPHFSPQIPQKDEKLQKDIF
jgi:hypothetical protein